MREKTNYYFISILTTYLLFIILVILYFSFFTNIIKIPECIIHKLLHIYCPACGITRSLISLLRLDIITSLYYNPIVIYTFIFVNVYIINELAFLIIKKKLNIPYKLIVRIGLIILFANCIIKNIFGIQLIII